MAQDRNPLSALWHELRYAFDRAFKTGDRRAEFETKYRKHGDYFGYLTKPYELEKYARTLDRALTLRRGRASALEIGCSVGVFTKMIAPVFDAVAASDIAQEALAMAEANVAGAGRVSYVHGDLLSLTTDTPFDVIFCAEVLYYIREPDAPAVCRALDRLLKPDGIILEVTRADRTSEPKFFHGWDKVLGGHFKIVAREIVDDPARPYEIVAYARRA